MNKLKKKVTKAVKKAREADLRYLLFPSRPPRAMEFRVWDSDLQRFRYIRTMEDLKFWTWAPTDGPNTPITEFCWEQFIGMRDIENNKIFEGDIIKGIFKPVEFSDPKGHIEIAIVEYNSQYAYFDLNRKFSSSGKFSYMEWPWDWADEIRVIGNIHQNSELLKYVKRRKLRKEYPNLI